MDQSETVDDTEVLHVRANTRSASPPTALNSRKLKLTVKVPRHGAPDPSAPDGKSKSKFMDITYDDPVTVSNVISKDVAGKIRKEAIDKLVEVQDERFSEFSNITNVLSKVKILDTSAWPGDLKDLAKFCVEDVKFLLEHFRVPLQSAGISGDVEVLREFREFKMYYGPRIHEKEIKLKSKDFWPWVYNCNIGKYKNLFLLIELLMCIPFSTAVVERGFSSARRIITDWRATLSHPLINDCMHFSTRQSRLNDKSYRQSLVDRACVSFIECSEKESAHDGLGTLTNRRIQKILRGLKCSETPVKEFVVKVTDAIDIDERESENAESDNDAIIDVELE